MKRQAKPEIANWKLLSDVTRIKSIPIKLEFHDWRIECVVCRWTTVTEFKRIKTLECSNCRVTAQIRENQRLHEIARLNKRGMLNQMQLFPIE